MNAKQRQPGSTTSSSVEELLAAARFAVPDLVASHVDRPRLLDPLARADIVPLVLVSGPAGAGKTSLAAEWVRSGAGAGTTGWVTFEDSDTGFWSAVLESLTRQGLELPVPVHEDTADPALGKERLVALAEMLAETPHRWTVVVDGYEMVSLDIAREVDFLLRHTLGHLCFVFVGRVDPVLPLYRYRLSDSLLEIRAADLAFTDHEAAALLESLGVRLSPESVHDLNARIQGWAAGLRFVARALVGRKDPEACVGAVVSQTGDINEYLLGEVLDAQPPAVRQFLLDTCVPDLLQPGLVEELGGAKASRVLEEVSKANAFIEPLAEQPGAYRYYPFFRDLLRAQLAYESPDRLVELHRRAAAWFHRAGLIDRSIVHLAATGSWDAVAEQIVEGLLVGRLLLEGRDGKVRHAATEVPADRTSCEACVVRAAVALANGDRGGCAKELSAARSARRTSSATDDPVAVSIAVLDAVRAGHAEDVNTAATLAEEAERIIDGGRPGADAQAEMYALVQYSLGVVALRRGDLRRARKTVTEALAVDRTGRYPSFKADCLGYLAVIDAIEGYLSRARRTALEAQTAAADAGIPVADRSPAAEVALAFVALEQYELKAAREHVASALHAPALAGDPVSRTLLETVAAGLERAAGHLQAALGRLDAAAAHISSTDPWLADYLRVEAAKLSVASGRAELALRELEGVEAPDEPQAAVVAAAAYAEEGQDAYLAESLSLARRGPQALRTQVTGLIVEVVQESRRRAPGRARVVLDRSLRLAAPEGLRRPFREAGPAVQRLLSTDRRLLLEHPWLNHSGPSPRPAAAQSPGGGRAGAARPPQSTQVVETLTAKELEVLGHLEELLTTEEIAEKMFVSVNTVRTHVRSILRKLGVTRRNAAVRKARELGLFDR